MVNKRLRYIIIHVDWQKIAAVLHVHIHVHADADNNVLHVRTLYMYVWY